MDFVLFGRRLFWTCVWILFLLSEILEESSECLISLLDCMLNRPGIQSL